MITYILDFIIADRFSLGKGARFRATDLSLELLALNFWDELCPFFVDNSTLLLGECFADLLPSGGINSAHLFIYSLTLSNHIFHFNFMEFLLAY